MYKYSASSLGRIKTCHEDLQKLAFEVIKARPCTVTCGYRDAEAQALAFKTGHSKARPGQSKHNRRPSDAIDIVPTEWLGYWASRKDASLKEITQWGELVMTTAHRLGLKIRWGYDWDSDGDFTDQTIHDAPHFERVD